MCSPIGTPPPSTPEARVPPSGESLAVDAVRALARASRLLERASGELNLAHYRVLSAIASGDQRASRIAARLAIGKPTVSATVEALCHRGLLVRSRGADDQRVDVLCLTPEGETVLQRVEAAMVERITDLGRRTPQGEQLLQSLVWMGAAIDEVVAQRHRPARP
ncbi:MAG TPA: MarR family winged helix-turn-helix transcriptional regulator [Acidimicrobiales bacterium]|nr:MarR family winged helix-turn-helix transcriptional regulator [Acidimicrobiales bacterium]